MFLYQLNHFRIEKKKSSIKIVFQEEDYDHFDRYLEYQQSQDINNIDVMMNFFHQLMRDIHENL